MHLCIAPIKPSTTDLKTTATLREQFRMDKSINQIILHAESTCLTIRRDLYLQQGHSKKANGLNWKDKHHQSNFLNALQCADYNMTLPSGEELQQWGLVKLYSGSGGLVKLSWRGRRPGRRRGQRASSRNAAHMVSSRFCARASYWISDRTP